MLLCNTAPMELPIDTVFTKLFNNKAAAIQLYNALYKKELPEDTPVKIVTLDDVLFTKRKNDVAFMIDGHFLIFVEHQSTVNENMPLRLLLYVVQEYEKLIGYRIEKGKQVSNPLLYKKELIKIPKPEFFVLYNGTENLKEVKEDGTTKVVTEKVMRLSDAFIKKNENENSLELCVKLIDVGYDKNHQSLYRDNPHDKGKEKEVENLTLLGEYSYFIKKVEEYKKQYDSLEEAIKTAAKHCIEKGILKEFLLENETEVVVMLFGVYDEEMEKQVLIQEAEARVRKEERTKAEIRIEKERTKAAENLINTLLNFGHSDEEIITALQINPEITEKQAGEYLKKLRSKSFS